MTRHVTFIFTFLLLFGCSSTQVAIPKVDPVWPESIHPRRLVDETFGDNRVMIDSFGDPILLVGHRSIIDL